MAWSWRSLADRNKSKANQKQTEEASPPPNAYPFVVPSYRRGGPYSDEAMPTFADNPSRSGVKERYWTPTQQMQFWPQGWGPPTNQPPGQWSGYNQDNLTRSKRDETVLNADEGSVAWINQYRFTNHQNPYEWGSNMGIDTGRVQRPPHEYAMLRAPDKNYLGRRDLNGMHYSAAQTVTDQQALALKGMVPGRHRRSTFRLEPIAFGELTTTIAERSSFAPQQATFESPASQGYNRSFRLS